jgi:GxxExxY protein
MKVHNTLGNGFQEVIYQRSLAIEMDRQGLSFAREMWMEIFYEGIKVGSRRVDFFVENVIMLELKAVIQLDEAHLAQAMNYCEAYGLPVGLLINFGSRSLQYKRVYNLKHPDNRGYKK